MGTTVGGVRHGCMADRTFSDSRCIPLGLDCRRDVVRLVTVGTGFISELGMGRVVACLALQFAVTGAETEQVPALRGRIRIGSKTRVGPGFERTVSLDSHSFLCTVVVAGLAGGHVEPTLTRFVAHSQH